MRRRRVDTSQWMIFGDFEAGRSVRLGGRSIASARPAGRRRMSGGRVHAEPVDIRPHRHSLEAAISVATLLCHETLHCRNEVGNGCREAGYRPEKGFVVLDRVRRRNVLRLLSYRDLGKRIQRSRGIEQGKFVMRWGGRALVGADGEDRFLLGPPQQEGGVGFRARHLIVLSSHARPLTRRGRSSPDVVAPG